MSDDALELLRAILGELVGLRGDLVPQRRRLAPVDRAALEALLPAVGAAVGARIFSVAELRRHALLADQAALRDALARGGGPRRIGRLLGRGAGVAVDGMRVAAVGHDREGKLWTITAETRETRAPA